MRNASARDAFLAWGDFMRARVSLVLLSLRENEELLVVYQPLSYLLLGKLRTLTVKMLLRNFTFSSCSYAIAVCRLVVLKASLSSRDKSRD